MKDKKSMQKNKIDKVNFEEMEKVEEFGSAQDYITGAGIGLGIVVAIVTLT